MSLYTKLMLLANPYLSSRVEYPFQ